MKTFLILSLFLATVSPSALGADDAPVTITVPKPLTSDYAFDIQCTPAVPIKVGDSLHFEIQVISRKGTFSADSEGLLEIFDAQNRILSCDLRRMAQGNNLKFEFDLSPKYLGKSRFAFKCTGVDEKGATTADVLWVQLRDYGTTGAQ